MKTKPSAPLGMGEFVTLMAMMISLVALATDAMLPALPNMGQDLGVQFSNDNQLVISILFFGMAIGQLIYGPLSDKIGRKPAIYMGYLFFVVGCLFSIFASNFTVMLIGRALQGLGTAAPRTVTVALIRDQYQGDHMARVMSFVMSVFMFVPLIAPALGQGIIVLSHWRGIFVVFLFLAVLTLVWFAMRQPETLQPEKRLPFSLRHIAKAIVEIFQTRLALGYTLAMGLIGGAFLGYLTSAQQVFQEAYPLGALFPLYFSILALPLLAAFFSNARLVLKYGMRRMSLLAIWVLTVISLAFFVYAYLQQGLPSLWTFIAYFLMTFYCVGILFGNLNAQAMEPLGHIAGVGAAVVGSLSMFISMAIGTWIGRAFDQTILPLVGGFAAMGILTILTISWTEARGKVSQKV